MGSDPIYGYARSFSKWGLTPFISYAAARNLTERLRPSCLAE
jgi:hypothetical protein